MSSEGQADIALFEPVRQVICEVLALPSDAISPQSSMKTIAEWDSLRFLLVVDALERKFETRFTREQMPFLKSVEGIMKELKRSLS